MKKTQARIEHLAAEYALGSLTGRARLRFERWMVESHLVRQEVWYWEAKLGRLGELVPVEKPPKRVWRDIESRLWPQERQRSGLSRVSLWRGWATLASATAVVLAVLLWWQPTTQIPDPVSHLAGAVIQPDSDQPLWLVSEPSTTNALQLRTVAARPADTGRDYELWVVQSTGDPISLGVISVGGEHRVTLTAVAREALQNSRTLAISLEPEGGSTTGTPTGPILHIVQLYEL